MFVGKQIFIGSWGRYFVDKLCDVTRECNSYLIYSQTTEGVIFLIYFIMLQNRVIFLVHTSISGKGNHLTGFRERWTEKTMMAIKKKCL